jgi:hypothetical protein
MQVTVILGTTEYNSSETAWKFPQCRNASEFLLGDVSFYPDYPVSVLVIFLVRPGQMPMQCSKLDANHFTHPSLLAIVQPLDPIYTELLSRPLRELHKCRQNSLQ